MTYVELYKSSWGTFLPAEPYIRLNDEDNIKNKEIEDFIKTVIVFGEDFPVGKGDVVLNWCKQMDRVAQREKKIKDLLDD